MVESFSGVRGIWGDDLTSREVLSYAAAIKKYILNIKKEPTIVIGMDSRHSGKEILEIFINSFIDSGITVLDVGIKPTPLIENYVRYCNAEAGIIITASHNPPEYNGWKILEKRGNILYPHNMSKIIHDSKNIIDIPPIIKKGTVIKKYDECINSYIDFIDKILNEYNLKKYLDKFSQKILLDPNGGAASYIACSILKKLRIHADEINNNLGTFNRKIEPNSESLSFLSNTLGDYSFAAGFDCDADRVELVSKENGVVSGQKVFGIIADLILSDNQSEKNIIVANDATSYLVKFIAKKYGAIWKEVEVGEVNIVKYSDKTNILLGGEGSSGGVIIPPSRCRDGILSLIFVVAYLGKHKLTLDQAISALPKYTTLVENIHTDINWESFKKNITSILVKKEIPFQTTGGESGGIKMFFENGWAWMRGSKTEEGLIRIMADGKDKYEVEKILILAKNFLA